MAAGSNKSYKANSKKHTNQKSGNKKSSGRRKVHKQKTDENRELFHNEITLMVTLVVSLLLILSNFNLSGKVGEIINGVTFGLFGFIAYFLPFLLFFGIAFYIANRGNSVAIRKLISSISLGVVLAALIQLITIGADSDMKITEYYLESAEEKNGGGLIGGVLCSIFHPLFGTVGTVIILIALVLIFVMFITGKAILTYLGIKSGDSFKQIKEKRARWEEENNQEEEEGEEITRRPPQTVLLKNSQKEPGIQPVQKTNEEGFLAQLKKKKTKTVAAGEKNKPNKSGFDMEEIHPIDMDDITIQRADKPYEEEKEKNYTYEEQLKQKFGQNKEAGQPVHTNPERPGIDEDIERLLQAANQSRKEEMEAWGYFDNSKEEDSKGNSFNQEENHEAEEALKPLNLTKETSFEDKAINQNENFVQSKKFTQGGENLTQDENHTQGGNTTQAGALSNAGEGENKDFSDIQINQKTEENKAYVFPPLDLLTKPKNDVKGMSDRDLKETAVKLQKTLESFGVRVTITNVSCGPAVTRYELQPEQGVKVSRITGLADDIKLNLAAADVRIEAPIPGKAAVGIEVPNKENSAVMFRELIETKEFKKHPSDIAFAVGKDIGGQTIVTDIGKMPHLLIAGATGSGKSVCINTLIMSILYKAKPSDVKMIMIDPKVVELSVYNGIPHLLIPVVTDPKKASAALNWAVMEMTERYKKFADLGVRDVKGYNEKIETVAEYQDERYQKMPQIVIIVDELADLMMVAPGDVEDAICRLAQMARAAGLHLIIATQRPSVNVITGLIKANIPSRIAFSVSSAIDSRTIIDGAGAEKLLGKGDMLFFPSGYPKPIRVQGAFVSDKEVGAVVEFLTSSNSGAEYSEDIANKISNAQAVEGSSSSTGNERDDYFIEAGKFIIEKDKASIGMLQRVYKIGFNRAARIMDQLSEAGVVGPEEGTKPRKILMTMEEFENYVDEYI